MGMVEAPEDGRVIGVVEYFESIVRKEGLISIPISSLLSLAIQKCGEEFDEFFYQLINIINK